MTAIATPIDDREMITFVSNQWRRAEATLPRFERRGSSTRMAALPHLA